MNDISTPIMSMPPKMTKLKFKSIRKQQDMPIVVFADFRCIVDWIQRHNSAHKDYSQQHRPVSVRWKLLSLLDCPDELNMELSGENVVHLFLLHMRDLQERLMKAVMRNKRRKMTADDRR